MIEKFDCTGCGACYNICEKNAVIKRKNKLGFYYPVINKEICNKCQRCTNICPTNHIQKKSIFYSDLSKCHSFIAVAKSEYELDSSSSGGAFSALVKSFFKEETGFLYAAEFNEEFTLQHIEYKIGEDNFSPSKKSKYVQSDFWQIYKVAKERLKAGYKVMIVGTPCQIAGIKAYLGNKYEKLLLVDLLCTGVGSPAVLNEHIKLLSKRRNKKVINYIMRNKVRDKIGRWSVMEYYIEYEDGSVEKNGFYSNMFRRIFGKRHFFRDSCYSCKFKKPERCGDITIGDWWGNRYSEYLKCDKGVSAVIINNERYIYLKKEMAEIMYVHDIDYSEIIEQQPALKNGIIKNESPRLKRYNSKSIQMQLYLDSIFPVSELTKSFIKKILPSTILKRFIKT